MTLLYWSLAWLAGIAIASGVRLPWWTIALGCGVSLLLALIKRNRNLLAGLFLSLGMARYILALPSFGPGDLAHYNDYPHRAQVTGIVARYPDVKDTYIRLTVAAQELLLEEQRIPVRGLFLVWAPAFSGIQYGDRILAEGFLATPPEWKDFSYRDYLARQGVFSVMRRSKVRLLERGQGSPFWAALYAFRDKAHRVILQTVHEPEASLLSGILLGIEHGIPTDLMEAFRRTGTSHIIAISGFNIAVLVGFINGFLKRLAGKKAWPLVIMGIALYTLLVGADAAVVRAAIMGGLYVLAGAVDRPTFAPVSLSFAALVMSAINPFVLWDVGFQLSFAATLGLIIIVPPAEKKLQDMLLPRLPKALAGKVLNLVNEAVVVTLAAQMATLPLIIHYFGTLSVIGPLANALIIPAQPGVMLWGGASLLAGLLWLPLGRILGWVAWLYTAYTIRCVETLSRPEWAAMTVKDWKGEFVLGYYTIATLVWFIARNWSELKSTIRQRWRFGTTVSALGIAATVVWVAALAQPDGRLHVVFCDVGEGDGIFIRTPQGQEILVDGGPAPSRYLDCIGRRMPFWDHYIDLVILTHPDDDHLNGLVAVLERYRVGAIVEPGIKSKSPAYRRWEKLIVEKAIPRYEGRRGMDIRTGDGLVMHILNPGDKENCGGDNNCSLVIKLVAGKVSFLLTGDAEEEAEADMLASAWELTSTVLKVAHHGSKSSTSRPFLEAISPQIAIISVGSDNRFGHPAPAVLKRLKGIKVFRTDRNGTIEMVTDGERLWVKTQR